MTAHTAAAVAHRPINPLPTGIVWVTAAVSELMRQTSPRESETQTALSPAVKATGEPMGTSVVAAFEAILAGAPEDYRLAKSADFALEVREHEQEPVAKRRQPIALAQ